MKRHLKTVIKTVIVIFIAGIAFYFWKLSPVKVQTCEVKESAVTQTVFGTGTLEGKTRLAISPRETGSVRKLYADQGEFVKAGTLLVEMDADHVTAWSRGGATDINNCQMLCKTHNRAKGNK